MHITASHITYLLLCPRKLWLHARGMRMEDNSNAVAAGKLLGKTTYPRRHQKYRELDLGNLKIDHYDPRENLVREVKKSPKLEHAHVAQVKYYLRALERRGVQGARGLIEYPSQRRSTQVELTAADRHEIDRWETEVRRICELPHCPPLEKKTYCRNCAFRDFCYV